MFSFFDSFYSQKLTQNITEKLLQYITNQIDARSVSLCKNLFNAVRLEKLLGKTASKPHLVDLQTNFLDAGIVLGTHLMIESMTSVQHTVSELFEWLIQG